MKIYLNETNDLVKDVDGYWELCFKDGGLNRALSKFEASFIEAALKFGAENPVRPIIYVAETVGTRTYYEGGYETWKNIIDIDTDIDRLRVRVNWYYQSRAHYYGNRPPRFESTKSMKSSEYYSDSGGCGHSEHVVLREFPPLEVK